MRERFGWGHFMRNALGGDILCGHVLGGGHFMRNALGGDIL